MIDDSDVLLVSRDQSGRLSVSANVTIKHSPTAFSESVVPGQGPPYSHRDRDWRRDRDRHGDRDS